VVEKKDLRKKEMGLGGGRRQTQIFGQQKGGESRETQNIATKKGAPQCNSFKRRIKNLKNESEKKWEGPETEKKKKPLCPSFEKKGGLKVVLR